MKLGIVYSAAQLLWLGWMHNDAKIIRENLTKAKIFPCEKRSLRMRLNSAKQPLNKLSVLFAFQKKPVCFERYVTFTEENIQYSKMTEHRLTNLLREYSD